MQDKFQAEHIDDFCALLTNASPGLNGGEFRFEQCWVRKDDTI